MPRVAVIGCGDVATVHFEAIAALGDAELVAVCDSDPERLALAEGAHGVPGYSDHVRMLEEVRPDVVHVCTPHHQHADPAIAALGRGINVISEKPLASTLADALRLAAAAAASPARIGICFQNRYNAAVQALHGRLSSGEFGAVLGGSGTVMWHRDAAYYASRPWRGTWAGGGGGLLMNQAIHTLDLLQWLMGEVAGVAGHAATHALADAIEVEDTAELVLTHTGGARSVFYATLANTVNAPVTVDIVTEKADFHLRGDLTITHGDGRVEVVRERRAASGGRDYWGVSHQLYIADFYAQLGQDGPFWIDPQEALKTLRIIKDVYAQSYPDRPAEVA
ncbi:MULTISPECIES: Gfo/Idh/MocA family protein [unclassified Arthrobacter]|uniref:Gfo/Idh/MocA family oxidoreductase n=1 Tax=unclassified Arthrobacter TaxID=235627 RepID=UPI00159E4DF1|nr:MULTISPECIES: Gfo/Idh/MocA family oxidoreductase [unclassified Arthrobacter]MCQ9162890.1 Gfo/Idh/MocA family oxidoreductase [Arthrobacter sp. STN4]NVM97426.1 Gfo/Idh/MocA family oxidoreductase [Arthrobacter sp. SDTb3-6]